LDNHGRILYYNTTAVVQFLLAHPVIQTGDYVGVFYTRSDSKQTKPSNEHKIMVNLGTSAAELYKPRQEISADRANEVGLKPCNSVIHGKFLIITQEKFDAHWLTVQSQNPSRCGFAILKQFELCISPVARPHILKKPCLVY